MSSKPQLRAQARPLEGTLPFASYAQIVRMLLPLTEKISFYDAAGNALWISDGLEEPELRLHVENLLARYADYAEDVIPADDSASDQAQPTYVFPIRDQSRLLVGALVIVFRDLPANATYRRLETVERLLGPLLEVLSHGWRAAPAAPEPAPMLTAAVSELTRSVEPGDSTPLPALLRRTLANSTHHLQCSFGAFVVTERPFTLSHRASPDDSDLAMTAAIEAVREPMLKLMQVRSEPLIVNSAAPSGRDSIAPYKFLVLPLRSASNRLAALVLLFRSKQARDFTRADVTELTQILSRLAPQTLAELAGEPPPPIVRPRPAAPPPPTLTRPVAQRVSTPTKIIIPPPRPTRSSAPVPLVITPDAKPTMEDRIRAALRDGSFDLFAQRISPLRNQQRPARFEVLVRMQDANVLRPPASFFEAAQASTLMPDLDRWVIRSLLTTLRNNAALVRSGGWEFCINIAAQSLIADRFSEFIVAEVCRSSIPAGLLVFEISECDALEHQYALEFLGARLRDVGCRIALDNCRAGLTTFGPLHKWPVSCVKIDGSLIRNISNSTRSESLVRAVAQLATSMGIETVAERVESASLCDKLLDMGIDYAQGFHFGQPQPLATLFR